VVIFAGCRLLQKHRLYSVFIKDMQLVCDRKLTSHRCGSRINNEVQAS